MSINAFENVLVYGFTDTCIYIRNVKFTVSLLLIIVKAALFVKASIFFFMNMRCQ